MNFPFEVHDSHGAGASFTEEYLELLGSPAHWLFELTFSLIFDIIVIALIYGIVIKKIIIPRLRKKIHAEVDQEHGIAPHD